MGVDRNAGAADRFVGQRGCQRVEEQTEGHVVPRGGLNETLRCGDSHRNRPQGVGGDVDTLAELGGNPQLARILPTMQIHLLRLQVQPYTTAAGLGEQLRDYAEITGAVLAGNAPRAERAMRKHIRRARARYLRLPDEAFRMPDGEG